MLPGTRYSFCRVMIHAGKTTFDSSGALLFFFSRAVLPARIIRRNTFHIYNFCTIHMYVDICVTFYRIHYITGDHGKWDQILLI